MEEWISGLLESLLGQHPLVIYLFLFVSAVVENLFPPVPGDTITAFGAFLVGTGRLEYLAVYGVTTAGSVAGFMALYAAGRALGKAHFMERNYRFFSADTIITAERWFNAHGRYIVLANRFLPGIRSVISIVSGISRLPAHRVLLFATLSAAAWNLAWIQAGYLLGNNWETVKTGTGELLKRYNIVAGIIMAIALAVVLAYRYRKKPGNGMPRQ